MRHYTQEYIGQLLTRFMDGTTTIAEEDALAQYFAEGRDIPAEWSDYRQLFAELEAMKPHPVRQPRRRWLWWGAAAAVVLFVAIVSQQTEQAGPTEGLLAIERDTDGVLRPEAPNEEPLPDTAALMRRLERQYPAPAKRRLRKPQPTMTDIDKAYALMARAEEEAAREVAESHAAALHALLTAEGYVPIRLEDGTIEYMKETEYLTYEE